MPVARDADPWVRPPMGASATSSRYGVRRDGPGPTEDYSFADLLDILNPLQHIPLVSSFYRQLTGDEVKPSAQVMGATLYGGPAGLIVAANLTVAQQAVGESPADMMVASLLGPDEPDGVVDAHAIAALEEAEMPLPARADAFLPPPANFNSPKWPWVQKGEHDRA